MYMYNGEVYKMVRLYRHIHLDIGELICMMESLKGKRICNVNNNMDGRVHIDTGHDRPTSDMR